MTAAGADIFLEKDQFRLAATTFSGDCTITTCVTSFNGTNRYDKAGLMFRTDTTPGSALLMIHVSHAGQIQGIMRMTPDSKTFAFISEDTMHAFPFWLRLTRQSGLCIAWTSPDGKNWEARGSFNVPGLSGPVLAGLALCSHNDGVPATAVFDQVAATTP